MLFFFFFWGGWGRTLSKVKHPAFLFLHKSGDAEEEGGTKLAFEKRHLNDKALHQINYIRLETKHNNGPLTTINSVTLHNSSHISYRSQHKLSSGDAEKFNDYKSEQCLCVSKLKIV